MAYICRLVDFLFMYTVFRGRWLGAMYSQIRIDGLVPYTAKSELMAWFHIQLNQNWWLGAMYSQIRTDALDHRMKNGELAPINWLWPHSLTPVNWLWPHSLAPVNWLWPHSLTPVNWLWPHSLAPVNWLWPHSLAPVNWLWPHSLAPVNWLWPHFLACCVALSFSQNRLAATDSLCRV